MDSMLQQITENDFLESNALILFSEYKTSRNFGIFKFNNNSYKLSWQSDVSKPIITQITDNIYSIGIDLNFAIIDFKSNQILLNLDFFSFYYYTKLLDNFIYIVTELEIIKVDTMNFKVVKIISLPDIFKEMTVLDDKIVIQCFDDRIVEISR
jgi:hypothetical protein